jgi:hypothetical protein
MKNLLKSGLQSFSEINRKYSQPRIKQTKLVSIALLALRLYLLLLVGVLFYKFFTTVAK